MDRAITAPHCKFNNNMSYNRICESRQAPSVKETPWQRQHGITKSHLDIGYMLFVTMNLLCIEFTFPQDCWCVSSCMTCFPSGCLGLWLASCPILGYLGLWITTRPSTVAHFGRHIPNELDCKFDIEENSLHLLQVYICSDTISIVTRILLYIVIHY